MLLLYKLREPKNYFEIQAETGKKLHDVKIAIGRRLVTGNTVSEEYIVFIINGLTKLRAF